MPPDVNRVRLLAGDRGAEVPLAGRDGETTGVGPGAAGLPRVHGVDAALDAALGSPVDAAEPSATGAAAAVALAAAALALAAVALALAAAALAAALSTVSGPAA